MYEVALARLRTPRGAASRLTIAFGRSGSKLTSRCHRPLSFSGGNPTTMVSLSAQSLRIPYAVNILPCFPSAANVHLCHLSLPSPGLAHPQVMPSTLCTTYHFPSTGLPPRYRHPREILPHAGSLSSPPCTPGTWHSGVNGSTGFGFDSDTPTWLVTLLFAVDVLADIHIVTR